MQHRELPAWFNSELRGEETAGVGMDGKGFRWPSGMVERHHQQRPKPFVERMGRSECVEFADQLGAGTEIEVKLDAAYQQGQPPLGKAAAFVVGVWAGNAVQRPSVDMEKCCLEQFSSATEIAGGSSLCCLFSQQFSRGEIEPDAAGWLGEPVAAAHVVDHNLCGAENVAQPGHGQTEPTHGAGRRSVTPYGVHESVLIHHMALA